MSIVPIIINDIRVKARLGATILEASLDAGIHIPHACFVPEVDPPVAGCKLCCVELNGKIVYACSETVAENMKIKTDTRELESLRRSRLQFPG